MKRSNIGGFTFRLCGFWIEVVTVNFVPSCVAIYRHDNRTLVKRFG